MADSAQQQQLQKQQAPSSPLLPQQAQVPLPSFTLPAFPEDTTRNLKALTLTSDIKPDDYLALLRRTTTSSTNSITIPPLPTSIETLTLELFSLGYPPGWLTQLGARLPRLRSLVVYSQLLAGVSRESREDAEAFFRVLAPGLRGLHLLDVFATPGFLGTVGAILHGREEEEEDKGGSGGRKEDAGRKSAGDDSASNAAKNNKNNAGGGGGGGLRFLEVNYTSQPADESFLARLPAADLPALVGPSLVTCAFNLAPPDVTDDPDDPANLVPPETSSGDEDDDEDDHEDGDGDVDHGAGEVATKAAEEKKKKKKKNKDEKPKHDRSAARGITPLHATHSPPLVAALTGGTAPTGLKLLNTSLFTLSVAQVSAITGAHPELLVLEVTVGVEAPAREPASAVAAAAVEGVTNATTDDDTSANDGKDNATPPASSPQPTFKTALISAVARAPTLQNITIHASPSLSFSLAASNTKSTALRDTFPSSAAEMAGLARLCPGLVEFRVDVLGRGEGGGVVEWVREGGGREWRGGVREARTQSDDGGGGEGKEKGEGPVVLGLERRRAGDG